VKFNNELTGAPAPEVALFQQYLNRVVEDPEGEINPLELFCDLETVKDQIDHLMDSLKNDVLLPQGKNLICASRNVTLNYVKGAVTRSVNNEAVFDVLKSREEWATIRANFKMSVANVEKYFPKEEQKTYIKVGSFRSPFFKIIKG
jgi:hypothetical protein